MGNGGTEEDKKNTVIDKPHPADPMNIQTAEAAFESVLKSAVQVLKEIHWMKELLMM